MARAGQGEAGQDGADGAGTGLMDKADLKMLLKLSARRPVSCVVALTKDKQGIVLLHKRTRPRKLAAAAKQDARAAGLELDPASIRFGRASVDGASDSARVLFTVNRDAPAGMERAVKPVLKGVNFPRCAFVTNTALENELDDGEDPDDAADGPGEPGAAAPQAAAPSSGAASQQPTGGAANQQTANEAESQQPTGEAADLQPAGLAANQQPANSLPTARPGQVPARRRRMLPAALPAAWSHLTPSLARQRPPGRPETRPRRRASRHRRWCRPTWPGPCGMRWRRTRPAGRSSCNSWPKPVRGRRAATRAQPRRGSPPCARPQPRPPCRPPVRPHLPHPPRW